MPIDPVGKQEKIKGDEYRVTMQKTLDTSDTCSDGGFNKKSGTRDTQFSTSWSGRTKGATKHTFKG